MKIALAGTVVDVEGPADDPYSQAAGAHAAALDGYADLVRSLPPNPLIFDVGANIGLSILAAAVARPDARIVGFEPGPATVVHLRRNTAGRANVEIVHAAVSSRPGSLRFHAAPYSAGSHVVGAGHISDDVQSTEVPAVTLDEVSERQGFRPDLVKIDVEGHEPEVLAGARRLMEAIRPLVYMEFNSWTLNAFAGHSPSAFAKAVWDCFDVEGWTDPLAFLHQNLVRDGCVSDLKMRLKPGARIPDLPEMSWPAEALADRREVGLLRKRVSDLEGSTSWRLTAPIRRLSRTLQAMRGT